MLTAAGFIVLSFLFVVGWFGVVFPQVFLCPKTESKVVALSDDNEFSQHSPGLPALCSPAGSMQNLFLK